MSEELIIYKDPSQPSDGVAAVIPLTNSKASRVDQSDGNLSGRKVVPCYTDSLGADFFSKKVNN